MSLRIRLPAEAFQPANAPETFEIELPQGGYTYLKFDLHGIATLRRLLHNQRQLELSRLGSADPRPLPTRQPTPEPQVLAPVDPLLRRIDRTKAREQVQTLTLEDLGL